MASSNKFTLRTNSHSELVSITSTISRMVSEMGLKDGLIHVFVLHTTCGITINENADPAVVDDLLARLEDVAPWSDSRDRHLEGKPNKMGMEDYWRRIARREEVWRSRAFYFQR